MDPAFATLLSAAGPALAAPPAGGSALDAWGPIGCELADLLGVRHGFYASSSALLVRPLRHSGPPLGIEQWNAASLWRADYPSEDWGPTLFFAEDLFGGQFCIRGGRVLAFEPETGALGDIGCASLAEWARLITADHRFRTGEPLAHAWRAAHGPLEPGRRLVPKVPFVVGSAYSVDNLYACEDAAGMRLRAAVARQLRGVPDSARVVFRPHTPGDGAGPPA